MKKTHKLQIKIFSCWLGKQVALLLVVVILVNYVSAFIQPKVARAADPNMILLWDTALGGAGPPAGWTFIDVAGTPVFYNAGGPVLPRGEASYTGTQGGAINHTHSMTPAANSSAPTGTARASVAGTGYSSSTHTHAVTGTATMTAASNYPAYRTLRVMRYSGIPSTIPQNAIAIFDSTVANQMPNADWTSYSATQSTNYVAGSSTSGSTGGSNTSAAHTVSGLSLGTVTGIVNTSGTTASRSTPSSHTHTACNTTNTTNTPAAEPPYVNVLLGYVNKVGGTTNDDKMIAMFDGTPTSGPTYGWEVLSNNGGPFYQKFLKSATTYSAGAGSDPTHSHAVVTCTSTSVGGTGVGGTGSGGIVAHTHTTSVTINGPDVTTLPLYQNVIFAKASYKFNSLTTDSGSYPSLGQTITMNSQVANNSTSNLTNTVIDYVIFIDGNANNAPDAGETYITANCAGSGAWAANNYTWQTTALNVNAGATANDTKNCANTNFPSNTTYVLYGSWYANGGSPVYASAFTTFTSIPTLTGLLYMVLVGSAVFLGVKTGVIKVKRTGSLDPDDIQDSPDDYFSNKHQDQNPGFNEAIKAPDQIRSIDDKGKN